MIKLGRIYKSVDKKWTISDYIIPVHEVYRPDFAKQRKYRYYDINYGFVAASPMTEYDILMFYEIVEGYE